MSSLDSVLQRFPQSAAGKGHAFEIACREFLTSDPVWSNVLEPSTVQLWESSPYRTGVDIGIDLTAEDKTGGVWAIQVKNWKKDKALPKSEVDKFLSASNTSVFSKRLLITTTDQISANATRAISEQEKPVWVLRRAELESSDFWSGYGDEAPSATPVKELREHQELAVSAVFRGLKNYNKGQLVMACGTGKTLTGLRIAEKLDVELTVVLVPSLLLVEQTMRAWLQDAQENFHSLAVCSDPSVAEKALGDTSSTRELGIPVTTDRAEISQFLQLQGKRVVFSTYQSQRTLIDSLNGLGLICDLVIADEAHRLAGIPGKDFALTLSELSFRRRMTLFMTATPRVFSSRIKAKAIDRGAEVISMDSESFGQVLHEYSFGQAIEDGVLSDYRIVVMAVSSEEIAADISENELLSFSGITAEASVLAAHVGLERARQKYGVRTAISFHSRVHNATHFATSHQKYLNDLHGDDLNVWCTSLSGKTPVSQRQQQLKKLDTVSAGFGLIANARCLTEGVDVPNLDAVVFVNPRQSMVDIVQAVGRVIRKGGEHKQFGWIILPLVVDADGELVESKRREQFKAILNVINGMKSHDKSLVDTLNSSREKLGAGVSAEWSSEKIILDLPKSMGAEFAAAIDLELLRGTSENWFEWFGRVEKAVEEFGSSFLTTNYVDEEGYSLGSWVARQRTAYNHEGLSQEKASLLESMSGWAWDAKEAWWEEGFAAFSDFYKTNGHVNVPQQHITPAGFTLGTWLSNRKQEHRDGRLAQHKIRILQEFEGYSPLPKNHWEEGYVHVLEAVDESGTADLVVDYSCAHGIQVGSWISNQRAAYRRGKLTREQIAKLESLPSWTWRKKENPRDLFNQSLEEYVNFIEQQGRYPSLSKDAPEEEKRLADWQGSQRQRYRSGKLSDASKRAILERLPSFAWSQKDEEWLQKLAAYKKFLNEEGDVHVPIKARVDGFSLANFVNSAIRQRDDGTLPRWKEEMLDEANDWYGKNSSRPGRWG